MKRLLAGLWLLALLSAASAQTLGPGASGPCSVFGTAAGTCAQGNAAVPYTGASGTVNLNAQQLTNVVVNTSGTITSTNATASSSKTTGALIVTGGIGSSGNVSAASFGASADFTSIVPISITDTGTGGVSWQQGPTVGSGNHSIYGFFGGSQLAMFMFASGEVQLPTNIASSGVNSGTLVVGGGAGIAGALYIGGQFITTTGTPTVASGACGTLTNGSIGSGDNQSHQLVIGAVATTSCAVTFSGSGLPAAPKSCTFSPANAAAAASTVLARIGTIATTGYTMTGAVLASTNWNVQCF